jgi:hypothetical protein
MRVASPAAFQLAWMAVSMARNWAVVSPASVCSCLSLVMITCGAAAVAALCRQGVRYLAAHCWQRGHHAHMSPLALRLP